MIATRETITAFFKAKVATIEDLTDPKLRFSVRANSQPPEFSNVLNLYFFDDDPVGPTDPTQRSLNASLELLIQIEPIEPLKAERLALEVIHAINQFMQPQVMPKKVYDEDSDTLVNAGSKITWRDSYPISWRPAANQDEHYVFYTAFLTFLYWEEKLAQAS